MTMLVTLEKLGVTYPNGHRAVEDVSFGLAGGRVCGLVGVNGAGKSTVFKAIMGFVRPTAGTISIMGGSVDAALKKNTVAYVPQAEDVDWNFPVLVEDVVMMGRYGHMGLWRRPRPADHAAVAAALERTGMAGYRRRQIGELSGGQKKRVFVARALAQDAQIILLDEPFSGVDIKTEDAMTRLFRQLAGEGRLILISTHNLGQVPALCDDVVIINKTLIAAGPVDTAFTQANLARAFGGLLRHVQLGGADLHDDADPRRVTVLTDDESPVVLYGESGEQKIVTPQKDKP